MGLAFGRSFGGAGLGRGLPLRWWQVSPQGGTLQRVRWGRGLSLGGTCNSPLCEDPQPGQRCQRPHGAVLPVPRGVRTSIPEPGREKSKAGRGSRKKTERGRISGDFGYPISGGKEEEERTVRKADGNIRTTIRWTQVDGIMKRHTTGVLCTNSSICSQMDFS
ncbi:hypothetical protein LEMLEM_LOCUS16608 [Lemmus lemmus]